MDIEHTFLTRVKNTALAAVFTSIAFNTHIYAQTLPAEFTASYSAEVYGIEAARATYQLKHSDNSVHFSQQSRPVGFASLITNDKVNEESLLSMHNGQLLLDEYKYVQTSSDKDRDVLIQINWDDSADPLKGIASGVARGKQVQQEVIKPVWDTLSLQIPIMQMAEKINGPMKFDVFVKGKLKTYEFIKLGTENITVNGNTLKTIKIQRKGADASKPAYFWISPELRNLPVKIEKWKKGKPHLTLLLNNASFPADKSLRFKSNNADDF